MVTKKRPLRRTNDALGRITELLERNDARLSDVTREVALPVFLWASSALGTSSFLTRSARMIHVLNRACG